MSRVFCAIAAVFFFLAAVNANLLPNPTAWGLVALAIGCAIGGWNWVPWRRASP